MTRQPLLHIRFLYHSACPSHDQALARLRQALVNEDLEADIDVLEVTSETQAQRLNFFGSPTILINGQDIAPGSDGAAPALTCRAYVQENGRISPLPSLATLQSALRNAVSSPPSVSHGELPHDRS